MYTHRIIIIDCQYWHHGSGDDIDNFRQYDYEFAKQFGVRAIRLQTAEPQIAILSFSDAQGLANKIAGGSIGDLYNKSFDSLEQNLQEAIKQFLA